MISSNFLRTLGLACGLALLSGCSGFGSIDFSRPGRDMWQRPERVIEALEIAPGSQVADVGAGDGYFIAHLSQAVGPSGRVYAADVDEESLVALEERRSEEGLENVEVVTAGFDDPALPDASLDLILFVNSYHHIEDRPRYFAALRGDLREGGRVAILEPNAERTGFLGLMIDDDHQSERSAVVAEMQSAGYRVDASHDFLAVQIFEVFAPAD